MEVRSKNEGPGTSLPRRLTAMHHWHVGLDATVIERAGWLQPDYYQPSAEEARLVQAGVGVMDDSPLGKLDLVGRDLEPALAQFVPGGVHPRLRSSTLSISNTGLDTLAEPRLLRLADDHAWVLTDPRATDAVGRVISERIADFDCIHLTDITSVYAAIRVAGPDSRSLLGDLTAFDLRDSQFPDGAVAQASLANVRTIVHRADLDDLLAYELLLTRDYGEYVCEALMSAGREWNAIPFGLSAWKNLTGSS